MLRFVRQLLKVLVRQKEHEIRLASFGQDRTLTVDSAESVFCRDGKTIALYSVKSPRISIRPTEPNKERVVLYRASGKGGLCIFYYTTNPNRVLLASHDSLITIQRDDIYAVRKAFRRFTQNVKFTPPKRRPDPYDPPPEK